MAGERILLDENPLVIIPTVAVALGLNQAIVLQQVHYWVYKNQKAGRNYHEGHYWTYNTFKNWRDQFPFWSVSTIKRIFAELESKGFLITGHYNRLNIDRTTWYRINYEQLADSVKLVQWESKCTPEQLNLTPPIPETNTDIYREKIISIWSKTINGLKSQVNKSNFRTWLADLEPLSFDGETFVVGAKNAFIAEYLEKNLRSLIESELSRSAETRIQVSFQIGTGKED